MTLAALYIDHLRRPHIDAQPFALALADAGLEPEAACYRAWSAHDTAHDGITISATPPANPATGDRWFDPCELLRPDARSELRPEYRTRQQGGGWEQARGDGPACGRRPEK